MVPLLMLVSGIVGCFLGIMAMALVSILPDDEPPPRAEEPVIPEEQVW